MSSETPTGYVLDVANVVRRLEPPRTTRKKRTMRPFLEVARFLRGLGEDLVVTGIVDHRFWRQLGLGGEAELKSLLEEGVITESPPREKADRHILELAQRTGWIVVSHDLYRDDEYAEYRAAVRVTKPLITAGTVTMGDTRTIGDWIADEEAPRGPDPRKGGRTRKHGDGARTQPKRLDDADESAHKGSASQSPPEGSAGVEPGSPRNLRRPELGVQTLHVALAIHGILRTVSPGPLGYTQKRLVHILGPGDCSERVPGWFPEPVDIDAGVSDTLKLQGVSSEGTSVHDTGRRLCDLIPESGTYRLGLAIRRGGWLDLCIAAEGSASHRTVQVGRLDYNRRGFEDGGGS